MQPRPVLRRPALGSEDAVGHRDRHPVGFGFGFGSQADSADIVTRWVWMWSGCAVAALLVVGHDDVRP